MSPTVFGSYRTRTRDGAGALPHEKAPAAPPRRGACANCDAALAGPYCASCGQRAADPDPSLRELLADAAQELTDVDGKLVATVRALLLRPGHLTVEYLAGRPARYVSPVRIYLACSILLFAVLALQPPVPGRGRAEGFVFFGGVASFGYAPDAALVDAYERGTLRGVRGAVQRRLVEASRGGPAARARFERTVTNALPQAIFLLVPAYALLVLGAYRIGTARARRRRYPAYLAFALHVHAFAFALLAALFTVRIPVFAARAAFGPSAAIAAMNAAFALVAVAVVPALAVHLAAALRRVHGGSWTATVVRAVAIHAVYWALTAATATALVLLVILRA